MAAVNPAQPLPMMMTSFNGFSRSLTLDSSIGRHYATRKARKCNTRGEVFHVSLQNHSTLQLFTHQSGHLRGLVTGAAQKKFRPRCNALLSGAPFLLGQDFFGGVKCGIRGRDAAIDCSLQK